MKYTDENMFSFKDLIIFELSKNHGGDVEHGLKTIDAFAKLAKEEGIRAAVKLQFRDLNTYIHPKQVEAGDPRVKRYFSSHLSEEDFGKLVEATRAHGLLTISTPFDEASVDTIDRLNVEVIKIASASAKDKPLLERAVKSNKPIVCSTGGLTLEEMDDLVAFFKKHNATFTLLHCVGMYPTPKEEMQLNRIDVMKARYPDVPIGFSTHEDPENYSVVQIAHAKGAELLEKHIILKDEKFADDPSFTKVLGYTAQPEQVRNWIKAYKEAKIMCGTESEDSYIPKDIEIQSLQSMMRGVYVKEDVSKGEALSKDSVYFAVPLEEGKLDSGSFEEGMISDRDYKKDEALGA
tara:strand:- start:16425 stop:17471 length:1047 start_codon:yes stop_codon:yes gene_type:complete